MSNETWEDEFYPFPASRFKGSKNVGSFLRLLEIFIGTETRNL